MTTKEALHRLVDAIPERRLDTAAAALEPLVDPVLRAFLEAPLDGEELIPEDIAAIDEAAGELARGELIPWEEAAINQPRQT
jgi:hypothetical protein